MKYKSLKSLIWRCSSKVALQSATYVNKVQLWSVTFDPLGDTLTSWKANFTFYIWRAKSCYLLVEWFWRTFWTKNDDVILKKNCKLVIWRASCEYS